MTQRFCAFLNRSDRLRTNGYRHKSDVDASMPPPETRAFGEARERRLPSNLEPRASS